MLHPSIDPDTATQVERNPAIWWLLGALLVALFMAFWTVCSQQVHRAEARSTEMQMAQTALADCLQYIPGATIGSCTARIAPAGVAAQPAAQGATTVSYSFR